MSRGIPVSERKRNSGVRKRNSGVREEFRCQGIFSQSKVRGQNFL